MTIHKTIGDIGQTIEVQTLYHSGLYAVSRTPTIWHLFLITHTPTGITVSGRQYLSEAIKIADALDRAFKSTGKDVRWGDSQTLIMELNSVNDIVKVCAAARRTHTQ